MKNHLNILSLILFVLCGSQVSFAVEQDRTILSLTTLAPRSDLQRANLEENTKKTVNKISKLENRLRGYRNWRHDLRAIEPEKYPKTAVIADIHGNLDGLKMLVESLKKKGINRFIFTGDYFDRGKKSVEVYEYIKNLSESMDFEIEMTMGNHCLEFIQAVLFGGEEELTRWFILGGSHVLLNAGIDINQSIEKMHYDIRYNEKIQEMAKWMLKNLKLYHVDSKGFLHLHGGIFGKKTHQTIMYKNKRGLEALDLLQSELHSGNKEKNDSALSYLGMDNMGTSPLWRSFPNDGQEKNLPNFLDRLGVNGIVFGHAVFEEVFIYREKFFGIDLGLTEKFGAKGGALVYDSEGINFQYLDQKNNTLDQKQLLTADNILEDIEKEISRIEGTILKLKSEIHSISPKDSILASS